MEESDAYSDEIRHKGFPLGQFLKAEYQKKYRKSDKYTQRICDYVVNEGYAKTVREESREGIAEWIYTTPKGHSLLDGILGIPMGLMNEQWKRYGTLALTIQGFAAGSVVTGVVTFIRSLLN